MKTFTNFVQLNNPVFFVLPGRADINLKKQQWKNSVLLITEICIWRHQQKAPEKHTASFFLHEPEIMNKTLKVCTV